MAKKKIFKIVADDLEKVVIKVNASDNLTIAMNPYVNATYDYITVTKITNNDRTNVLTIIKKDGNTSSFSWGSSTTLISESLKILKRKVVEFCQENGIDGIRIN